MKTKIISLLFILIVGTGTAIASITKVDNIWYNFDNSNMTAEVTYQDYKPKPHSYNGIITIPSFVTYKGVIYNVTSIGGRAFESNTGLTSVVIPNGVTSIGVGAFYGCSGLTSVNIPESVEYIGGNAFTGCSSLRTVSLNSNTIVSKNFDSTNCLSTIFGDQVSEYIIGNSVTHIGALAFWNSEVISVTIGNNVTSIGRAAFDYCNRLWEVHISDIAAWCAISFSSLSSNPLYHASHLYLNDSEITELIIPHGVTTIGDYAFYNCGSLTSVEIPNSVTSIGEDAFLNCSQLCEVHISDIAAWCGILFSGISSNPLCCAHSSFYAHQLYLDDELITDLEIPNNVTSVGNYAFYGCRSLTSIIFPNSISSIGDNAFYNCSSLTSIQIKTRTPPSLGKDAFYGDNLLTSIYIPCGTMGAYKTKAGWSSYASSIIEDRSLPYAITTNALNGTISIDSICLDITLTAIPNEGYYFTQWSDGNKDNPRSFVLTQDTTFTAEFSNQYSINITCNEEYGSIIGENGTFEYLSEHTYEAVPNSGYHFTQWSDGNKDNPRTIILTQDTSLTAEFSKQYSIHVSCNEEQGSINGENGMFDYLSEHTYEAVPNNGYYFVKWSDGNKDNPRTIILTQDTSLTAEFSNQYSINITCNEEYGTIIGENGTFEYFSEHTYEAVPNSGYHFTQWSDGNKDNPRTITLTQDTSLTAEFSNQYSINVSCNEEQGSINGENGMFDYLSEHTYEAVPNSGYYFVKWSDGNKDNPRTIVLTQDTSLTAIFDILYNVSVLSDDPAMGSASFSDLLETQSLNYGQYPIGTNLIAKAIPNQGYKFSHWSDGLSANPRGITVQSDINLIAYFELEQNSYTVTVSSANSSMGTVSGGGTYEEGQTATVTATPKSGYKFTRWSNGSTANPYSFTVTSDVSLTAYFEQSTTPQSESKFWNISDAVFNSLGTITSQTTINGLTIHATASKPIVVDADAREINGYSFTHRLKFGGTGVNDARMLSFRVDGDCDIDIYLMSASGSADRTLNVDKGSFGSTLQQIPAYGSTISRGNVHYAGGATTIYLYSPSSGVNIYAIQVSYGSTLTPTEPIMVTCAEAAQIASSLSHNTQTSETYIVTGYITETDGVVSRGQQVFWMADTQNGGKVFESYWGNVTEKMLVGDKVSVEGKIMRYNSTYEIKNGDVTLIERDSPAQSFTVTVSSANSSMGTVSGGGTYEEGQTATVTATPKSGYKFTRWSNGSTANPYSFTVTSDVSLTAYFEQIPASQSESKFWNISDAVFNSLGTITSQTTINGLTIHATASKPIVVDADAREINGYSFTHRLKFGGTGVNDARMLSFRVDGDCDIDIYLMSASGSADRTLNVDKGSFGNTIQQIPAYGSTISEGNVHYAGGATTIYLYSPSSGVNIYAIRVTYGGKEEGIDDLYVQPQEEASKILHNGQIFILRGDKTYTLTGQEVK